MISYEGIDRNFRFLVLEVRRQLETTSRLLQDASDGLIRNVLSRDNYTDTLKALIEKKCVTYFRHAREIDKTSANRVTAINVATANLERIADFCVNLAIQVRGLERRELLRDIKFQDYFDELLKAIPRVGKAMENVDTSLALKVCRSENVLDKLYARDYGKIRDALRTGKDTDDLLRLLYAAHYLERMGDALLNVGEAILFAATGERLKLHEYLRLRDALTAHDPTASVGDFTVEFNWETRSGCRIAKVEENPDHGELEAIFKKGHADKLRGERENIERWNALLPGLPPRVLEFRDGEEDAALLLEFLDGFTIRDLALNGERELLDEALGALWNTLKTVWLATKEPEPTNAQYLRQVTSRLDEVYRLHPEFVDACYEIGAMRVASLDDLLEQAAAADDRLSAPFRVLIHGDFNADNILFNHEQKRVHFIDLYRSRVSDYAQDVSVFLVSNFRMPVLEGDIRETLNHVILRMYEFACEFAASQGDETFEARLALGLARAFITSTRFEIDPEFARAMYERAVYLLERVIALREGDEKNFHVNTEILVY